jgi:glycine betaine/proline transport system permease protein
MLTEFPEEVRIPLAGWVNSLVDWMLATFSEFFDGITTAVLWIILRTENILMGIPWPVIILIIIAGAWFSTRSVLTTALLAALMFMIGSFGFWDLAMMTLAIIIASVAISLLLGLPTGILVARNERVATAVRPILDGMQTMPAFVYLIPAMMFFGLGKVPAVFATVIYAVPPLIRLTDLGIRGVTNSAIEAAEAYGATPGQILKEVQLPLAMPAIMAGVNQTTMMALAMVVIASMIGAAGLGQEVLLAINRIDPGRGAEAGLSIVALAIVIDRITQGFAKRYEESIA